MNTPAITAHDLTRVHEVPGRHDTRVVALDHVSLQIPTGTFTAVVGASGSGKSTLLQCLAGLDRPTEGSVQLLGTDITRLRANRLASFRAANIGFVFQEYNLIASLTVADNVALPARLAGRRLGRGEIATALETVGLAHRAGLKPHQLSGGERQRVAIARVMASQPQVVFADEPTGALDVDSAGVVLDWLRGLTAHGTTVVMVTHDVEAAARADAVAVMAAGRIARWTDSSDPREVAELLHAVRTPGPAPVRPLADTTAA